MAYLKDIKLCIDCTFFGTPQGQRDRCLQPSRTMIHPVDGQELYPLAFTERTGISDDSCGSKAKYFVLDVHAQAEREIRRQEFEEAMRDAPTL